MSATPLEMGRRAPLIGEHTAEVPQEAGFTPEEIAELGRVGAVGPRGTRVIRRQSSVLGRRLTVESYNQPYRL